jgi:hypothetical protein
MNGENMTGSPGPPGSQGLYRKPELECFGTLRDLTQSGGAAFSDLWTTDSADGCIMTGSSSYTCVRK